MPQNSDPKPWRVLDRKIAYDYPPYISLQVDRVETSNGHILEKFHVVKLPNWINVMALTIDNQVIINRQYRHGLESVINELPSGVIDEGESPQAAAVRELQEETGYRFTDCIEVARYSPNPDKQDNWAYGFLARGGVAGERKLDASEDIAVRLVSLDEFQQMLKAGELPNGMHQATAWAGIAALSQDC